jgi:hypothetical protein
VGSSAEATTTADGDTTKGRPSTGATAGRPLSGASRPDTGGSRAARVSFMDSAQRRGGEVDEDADVPDVDGNLLVPEQEKTVEDIELERRLDAYEGRMDFTTLEADVCKRNLKKVPMKVRE